MKKLIIAGIAAGMACASVSAFASSGEGQINFTGEVIDSACTVVNGLSNPLTVSLGKFAKSAFTGSGSTTSTTRFSIQLKNCPDTVTSASVTFGGTPDGNNKDILAVTSGTGTASGVGVQLLDKTQTPLSLYTSSAAYTLTSGTTTNDLEFGARYIQTGGTVSAGVANAASTFTIVYN
ncbi:fimbrial protein [Enterobacter sichuanensis]|uniref:fimbrial protein n=1 Tax=Enterobacter sichuanensis TaxID=2071710 RepID=UPI0036D43D72